LLDTNGKVTNTEIFFESPEKSRPVAKYQIAPLKGNLTVKLRVSLDTSSSRTNADIDFFSSYDLVNNLKIDYILLDKGWSSQYYRFLYDKEHYFPVYENNKVVIFRVNNS
jgi:hypothetical protein